MVQAASSSRFSVLFRLAVAALLVVGAGGSAVAQSKPYLLVQGPSEASTYRFPLGARLEWQLVGEEDFFQARIVELFPESQAIRIDDLLLGFDKIAAIRVPRRAQGLRRYFRIQGVINLAIVGIAMLADRETRELRQRRNFAFGSAAFSGAMVLAGSIDRNVVREVSDDAKYVLKVAGGDIRAADDPNRG